MVISVLHSQGGQHKILKEFYSGNERVFVFAVSLLGAGEAYSVFLSMLSEPKLRESSKGLSRLTTLYLLGCSRDRR